MSINYINEKLIENIKYSDY